MEPDLAPNAPVDCCCPPNRLVVALDAGCPKVETPKGFLLALSDEGVDPSPLKNPPPAPPVEDPPKMDEVVVGLVLLLKMELDPVEG